MHDVKTGNALGLNEKLVRFYFNRVYTPLYDATTARFSVYRHLQEACASKFEFKGNESVLCVGIGTGNEIPYLLQRHSGLHLVGIDMSTEALKKASRRAKSLDKDVQLHKMDVRNLQFQNESFDKVLCLHVMDFVDDYEVATGEIIRVLKKQGQFVVTYPSKGEGFSLGINILKGNLRQNINSRKYFGALWEIIMQATVSLIYFPLLLRAKRRCYSRQDLEEIFSNINTVQFQVEEDTVYMDSIVYGKK